MVIFSRSVAEKVRNQMMFCFPTLSIYCFSITSRKRKHRRQRTRATQSNCCSVLYFLFSWTTPHATTPSWMHSIQDLGSHTAAWVYESWVKKIEEIKQRLVEFWQCTDTAFELKTPFSYFPILSGSAEAQTIWGSIIKRLLIAFFIGNTSAKKNQNPFTFVKVIARQRRDVFWDTV